MRDDILKSNDPYVGFMPSPRACRGGGAEDLLTLRSYDPYIGFSQAPEHVEGES
jgi:hypothetical protein